MIVLALCVALWVILLFVADTLARTLYHVHYTLTCLLSVPVQIAWVITGSRWQSRVL